MSLANVAFYMVVFRFGRYFLFGYYDYGRYCRGGDYFGLNWLWLCAYPRCGFEYNRTCCVIPCLIESTALTGAFSRRDSLRHVNSCRQGGHQRKHR
jgi:hypothetical protein